MNDGDWLALPADDEREKQSFSAGFGGQRGQVVERDVLSPALALWCDRTCIASHVETSNWSWYVG